MSTHTTRRDVVEAARARGLSDVETAERYGYALSAVRSIWAAQDAVNDLPDAVVVDPAAKGGRPVTRPCGTRSGYWRHRNRNETPCGPCQRAASVYRTAHRTPRRRKDTA